MQVSSDTRSASLALGFSCVAHTYSHLFQPLFFVAALTLGGELALTHGEVSQLIVVGAMLFGFAAPLAGWLGDKWGALPMMGIYFIGTGGAMILTGFATEPWQILSALALTGLFASIYHPVGIAWLIKNAANRGTALGINGIFGGLGPAIAALTAGSIIALAGWRSVFIIPGIIILLTGAIFVFCVSRGWIIDRHEDRAATPPARKGDAPRVFAVLAVTMLCTGIIYQATQAAMPKSFELNLKDIFGAGVFGISTMVAIVFFVAGLMQVAGGWLADRISPKVVYIGAFAIQLPFLILLANVSGPLVVVAAVIMISANNGALPAENMILARYVPRTRRALAYGFKFVLALGFAALGIQLQATLFDATGGFYWLFTVLGGVALMGAFAAVVLPSDNKLAAPQAAE